MTKLLFWHYVAKGSVQPDKPPFAKKPGNQTRLVVRHQLGLRKVVHAEYVRRGGCRVQSQLRREGQPGHHALLQPRQGSQYGLEDGRGEDLVVELGPDSIVKILACVLA